jgi:hypothetical protein
LFLYSCKKDKEIEPNTPNPEGPLELSSPFLELDYGNSYDYEGVGNNPLTLLNSGDLIVSSIEYNGTTDKLQLNRINLNGIIIWQKNFSQGYRYLSGNCFETNSGELIAIGTSIEQSNWTNSKVFIAKLNSVTGDTIWTRKYGHNYIDKGMVGYEDINNNYWIVDINHQDNNATLLHIASNGDSLSSVINYEATQPMYRDALITSTKSVLLVGESGNSISGKQPVFICKYTNGTKNFSTDIALDNFDELSVNNVCETSDGGYVIVGECFNLANTSLRYGFLLKVDVNGNKAWEKTLTQFNNSGIYSCIEKQPDVFYLGIGASSSAKLYKYDLTILSEINSSFISSFRDVQLIKNGNKLYRSLLGIKPSFYETVTLKAYTIN